MMKKLSDDLFEMACRWDMEAVDRLRDGLTASADTLRDCSDDLLRLVHRHARVAPRRSVGLRAASVFRAARQDMSKLGLLLATVGNPAADS